MAVCTVTMDITWMHCIAICMDPCFLAVWIWYQQCNAWKCTCRVLIWKVLIGVLCLMAWMRGLDFTSHFGRLPFNPQSWSMWCVTDRKSISISMMCHDSSEASLVIWTPWMILSLWTLSSWYYGSLPLTKLSNWHVDPRNRPKVKSASYWHVDTPNRWKV